MAYLNNIFSFYSSIIKSISNIKVPVSLRRVVFYSFGKLAMKMTKDDFKQITLPLKDFKDIASFFSRSIDLKLRPLSNDEVIAPCDGIISEYGNIQGQGQMIRVKGKPYSLNKLLGNDALSSNYSNGSYLVIYLSPRNYHRFHSPASGKIQHLDYIQGKCYPVNKLGQLLSKDVFSENCRVIVDISSEKANVCMAIVGACAVRGIKILKQKGNSIKKGEELGWFELGSSIVMVFDKRIFPDHKPLADDIKARGPIFKNDLLFH